MTLCDGWRMTEGQMVAVVHSVKVVSSLGLSFPARPDPPAAHADFNLDGRTTLDVAGCR
jgi:hypothetical protein